jgi:hypothetical protein
MARFKSVGRKAHVPLDIGSPIKKPAERAAEIECWIAACCASATADQISARSKVVPPGLIERDYRSASSRAQGRIHLGAGLPSGPIPMAAPFILSLVFSSYGGIIQPTLCFAACCLL